MYAHCMLTFQNAKAVVRLIKNALTTDISKILNNHENATNIIQI